MTARESSANRVVRMLDEGRPDWAISRATGWPATAIESMKTLLEHQRLRQSRDAAAASSGVGS